MYTDGLVWKYIRICEQDNEIDRKKLYDNCFYIRCKKGNYKDWISEICKKNLTIECTGIGNLKEIYDALKNEKDIKLIGSLIEQHPDWKNNWESFTTELKKIEWKPEKK